MGRPFFTPTWFIWLTNMVNKVKTCFLKKKHCGLWYLEIYWSCVYQLGYRLAAPLSTEPSTMMVLPGVLPCKMVVWPRSMMVLPCSEI